MKSLEFLKPTLATTLAIVLGWLLSARPAQAGYTVTLQQVGPDVVATGSGAIDLTGLTFVLSTSRSPAINPLFSRMGFIFTGPTSSKVDSYSFPSGGIGLGPAPTTAANSGSGNMVGIAGYLDDVGIFQGFLVSVPKGYVSGNALSDSATYNGKTFATLGVTHGRVWKWGTGTNQNFTLQILPGPPIYVLYNAATRQTAIWYLNNNAFVSGSYGPTLPAGWGVRGAADFNSDSHPDYALFNSATHQTALWYLSGPTYIGGAYGPTLPSSWELVTTADFNGDNKPDYVLYNAGTHQTALWYLNNNLFVSGASGPTLPAGWRVVGVADFDRDSHADYALFNSVTRQTAIWYLSGATFIRGAYGPTLPTGWALVATADFNGDGHPDYVLYNANTRQTAIWYLNNNAFVSGAYGPTLPAGWSLVAP